MTGFALVVMMCWLLIGSITNLGNYDDRALMVATVSSWIPCVLSPLKWKYKFILCATLTFPLGFALFGFCILVTVFVLGHNL